MLCLVNACVEDFYERAVDAISDAIFQMWCAAHKTAASRSAGADRSAAASRSVAAATAAAAERSVTVERSAPTAAAAAAAVATADDGDRKATVVAVVEKPMLTAKKRGLFARFKRNGGSDKKAKKSRASLFAPFKRFVKRRSGHDRTGSGSSGETIPVHVDDDGATGEQVHPAVAAAFANMAAHKKLALRASPPPAPRSNGLKVNVTAWIGALYPRSLFFVICWLQL